MNLAKVRLWPYICFSIGLIILAPIYFSTGRLYFLLPCLIIMFYQRSLIDCLWMAFFFGLLLDFLSSSSFLGLNVTSYCAATALLYPQRRNFFADNVSTLPLLTFFSAVSLTMLQLILTYIFERHILITLEWAITNIVLFPLFDSMYAFAVFLLPSMLFGKRRRYGNDFFMSSTRMGP